MEVDYSQQPGLEPIGPTSPHQGRYQDTTSKAETPAGHAYAPGWNAVGNESLKPERRIAGLRPVTFALIAALVAVIIIAAVGGGVGGSVAVSNAKDSARKEALASCPTAVSQTTSPSSTPSSTSSANTFSTTELAWGSVMSDPLPSSGCPANRKSNSTIYTSVNGPQKWRIYCGFDMPGFDMIQTNTPSIELCIETCANWNLAFTSGPACKGVAFVPSYILGQPEAGSPPSDCFLKSNASNALLSDKSTDPIEYDSVIVQ